MIELEEGKTPKPKAMLTEVVAERFMVEPEKLLTLLKKQIIHVDESLRREPTNAEVAVLLSVINTYQLDPMLKMIHAWIDKKGKLHWMVGYDGFVYFARRQNSNYSINYEYSKNDVTANGKTSWEYIEGTISVPGREPLTRRCYFKEWVTAKWYQPRNRHTMTMDTILIRAYFGFSAMDEADMEKMTQPTPEAMAEATHATMDELEKVFEDADAEILSDDPVLETSDDDMPEGCCFYDCSGPAKHKCEVCGGYFCDGHMDDFTVCVDCHKKNVTNANPELPL